MSNEDEDNHAAMTGPSYRMTGPTNRMTGPGNRGTGGFMGRILERGRESNRGFMERVLDRGLEQASRPSSAAPASTAQPLGRIDVLLYDIAGTLGLEQPSIAQALERYLNEIGRYAPAAWRTRSQSAVTASQSVEL